MTSGDKNDLKIAYIFESERELDDFNKVPICPYDEFVSLNEVL